PQTDRSELAMTDESREAPQAPPQFNNAESYAWECGWETGFAACQAELDEARKRYDDEHVMRLEDIEDNGKLTDQLEQAHAENARLREALKVLDEEVGMTTDDRPIGPGAP